MSTQTQNQTSTQALVKITEMDHIVLRSKDVEVSLKFYTEVLGMKAERVEQWRAARDPLSFGEDQRRHHHRLLRLRPGAYL